MAGTLKKGAASAPNVRTVWNFYVPAGQQATLLTQKDPTVGSEVAQGQIDGAGATAPIAITQGHGKITWKTEIAEHEFHQKIAARAKAAGVPIQGNGGLQFDIVMTTTVNGLPKMTTKVIGCSIGKYDRKISADGNMIALEGIALNVDTDGAPMFAEAQ